MIKKSEVDCWEVWEFNKEGQWRDSPNPPEGICPRFSPGSGYDMAEEYVMSRVLRYIADRGYDETSFVRNADGEIFFRLSGDRSSFHLILKKIIVSCASKKRFSLYNWSGA